MELSGPLGKPFTALSKYIEKMREFSNAEKAVDLD